MTSKWARWRLKSPASRLFIRPFIPWKKKKKAPRHWPLWGEFTGDRWILRTKSQLRGNCFHLMTSSCRRINVKSMSSRVSLQSRYGTTEARQKSMRCVGRFAVLRYECKGVIYLSKMWAKIYGAWPREPNGNHAWEVGDDCRPRYRKKSIPLHSWLKV